MIAVEEFANFTPSPIKFEFFDRKFDIRVRRSPFGESFTSLTVALRSQRDNSGSPVSQFHTFTELALNCSGSKERGQQRLGGLLGFSYDGL